MAINTDIRRVRASLVVLAALAWSACSSSDRRTPTEVPLVSDVQATPVVTGLEVPVHLAAPAGDARLFVAEQRGIIRIIKGGALLPTPFLDISSKVTIGLERGLFSMAFDPQFAQNRRFFVNYTGSAGATVIESYVVSASDPDVADAGSASLALRIEQPFANHNGGHIMFGPDNMLYVAMGDGGGANDPLGHAQDRNTLLGALLRIDVSAGAGYTVPAGNPFIGQAGTRPEIWAYGLRNPWRIAIDAMTSRLYIADVGEDAVEEVNVESRTAGGLNYGWSIMEGNTCFLTSSCDRAGLTVPRHTYDHSDGRCSITGGVVYRGLEMAALRGHYFYGDLCRAGVRTFLVGATGVVSEHRVWDVGAIGGALSFGIDGADELYVLTTGGGVYRLGLAPP